MSSLLVFNRVYRLEIQSVMLVFSTGFLNYCLLSGYLSLPSPTPPRVNKYTVYTYTKCKGGSMGVVSGDGVSDR
jgi:hypothetical protein